MVPAPVPAAPRPGHVRGPARRREAFVLRVGRGAGLLLLAFLTSSPAAAGDDDRPIEWKSVFLVGESSGSRGDHAVAGTDALSLDATQVGLLHVVVEGERDGFPVYCLEGPRIRLRGRAIPNRLLLTPEETGLAGAEIHWTELRPSGDARAWVRHRLPEGEGRWTLEVLGFPSDPRNPDEIAAWGTGRFAAAVSVTAPGRPVRVLASSGWDRSTTSSDREGSPGFRVSRAAGPTLAGHARGLERLPVLPGASAEQVRERVALRPVDLVLAAYEQMADAPLPPAASADLRAPEWAWLFRTIRSGVARRKVPTAAVVGPDARGVRWGADGVQAGDVLVSGDALALLDADDDDGWLDENDPVVAAVTGEIRRGVLHDVPGTDLSVLRARDFGALRSDLSRAGYGGLGLSPLFGNDLFRALREFQLDHELPTTGLPDEATLAALSEFLGRLRSSDRSGEASSP